MVEALLSHELTCFQTTWYSDLDSMLMLLLACTMTQAS